MPYLVYRALIAAIRASLHRALRADCLLKTMDYTTAVSLGGHAEGEWVDDAEPGERGGDGLHRLPHHQHGVVVHAAEPALPQKLPGQMTGWLTLGLGIEVLSVVIRYSAEFFGRQFTFVKLFENCYMLKMTPHIKLTARFYIHTNVLPGCCTSGPQPRPRPVSSVG